MAEFAKDLADWRSIRDTQVFAVADKGDSVAAHTAANGPVADANEKMADPMDKLFGDETDTAAAVSTRAGQDYGTGCAVNIAFLIAGLIAAFASAFLLTRGMLATVRRVAQVLESPIGPTGSARRATTPRSARSPAASTPCSTRAMDPPPNLAEHSDVDIVHCGLRMCQLDGRVLIGRLLWTSRAGWRRW